MWFISISFSPPFHFPTYYRKPGLIEVPLLSPIHHPPRPKKKKKRKNYSWKWSLNGLSDGRNMVFWIRVTARSGTNDLRGCTSRCQNGPLFVPGWFRNWSHTEHKGEYWHGRCFPQRIEDVRQPVAVFQGLCDPNRTGRRKCVTLVKCESVFLVVEERNMFLEVNYK